MIESRFRPVLVSFATRVKTEDGWQNTVVSTNGYEDTASADPSFFLLREGPSESRGLHILRLLIKSITYLD